MSDSMFTIHRYVIKTEKWNEPFYFFPLGDIHRFAHNCAEAEWLKTLDKIKKRKKDNPGRVFLIGMGDYDDLASTSERYKLEFSQLHDTTRESLDEMAERRTLDLIKELDFMRGSIIGMIEGNHHWRFQSGMTSTQYMCQKLGCKYLGGSSFIRVTFQYAKGGRTQCVEIWAHHTAGSGGGGRRIG